MRISIKAILPLIVVSLILLTSNGVNAQYNLQFNQVYSYSGGLGAGAYSPAWTVPTGYVWKVESVNSNENFVKVNINGTDVAVPVNFKCPFWLKPGDSISMHNTDGGSGGKTYYISIVEFKLTTP